MKRLVRSARHATIEARDEDDKIVPFGWDGDGADKIVDVELDGEELAFDRATIPGIDRHGLAFDRAPVTVRRDRCRRPHARRGVEHLEGDR